MNNVKTVFSWRQRQTKWHAKQKGEMTPES